MEVPLPGAAIDAGLKFAVAPAGRPEAESAIDELKLPEIVVVIVEVAELAWTIETTFGFDEMAKSPGDPEVLAVRAKSSTMKDVDKLLFSVPTR